MSRRRVTLSGYYGFRNAGDEAVLAGLVQSLRAQRTPAELEIEALSMSPQETRDVHGIDAAHRYRASELIHSLRKTDLLLSGGGSLLQDVTSAHGIFYYWGVVRLAQILGKKTMFVAQGIGPLVRPRSRKLVASIANRLNAITVRDPGSAALLREIGVTKTPIEVTADPALLLAPATPPQTVMGVTVALRPWEGLDSSFSTALAKACYDAAGHSVSASAVAMQPQSDCAAAQQFSTSWQQQGGKIDELYPAADTEPVDLNVLLTRLAGSELVVGMRLHALILAVACGVPCVALSYDPKVQAFMESCGQGDAVYDLQENSMDRLTALLQRIWRERAVRAAALKERHPQLRAAASRNAEAALALLP